MIVGRKCGEMCEEKDGMKKVVDLWRRRELEGLGERIRKVWKLRARGLA